MELRQLRYLLAIARRLSFTRAAEDVAVAQPALSQQIGALERELGVRLFDRTNRSVRLTEAGHALVRRAERILIDVDGATQEMSAFSGGLRGRVVIGTYQSFSEYTLPKLLGRFHSEYPGIEVALREGLADELLDHLQSGKIDAFVGDPADASPTPLHSLVSEALYDEEIAVAFASSHRFARATRIEIGELRDERWIIFRPGSSLTARLYRLARAEGFVPRVAFESADSLTVRSLVAEGLGIALFPRALGNTPGPNIALASVAPTPIIRHMALVTRSTAYGPAATIFLNFIRNQVARL